MSLFSRNNTTITTSSFLNQYQKSLKHNLLLRPRYLKPRTSSTNAPKFSSTKSTINNSTSSLSSSSIKQIYSNFKHLQTQNDIPFGITNTQRFLPSSQSTLTINVDSIPLSHRNYPLHKDSLNEGIACFINDNNNKLKQNYCKRSNSQDNTTINTERVVNPNVNEDYYFEISGRRKRYNKENSGNNSLSALIEKTPMCYFDKKGKRKVVNVNRSMERMNGSVEGLFGVGRKRRVEGKECGYENLKNVKEGGTGRKHYGVNNSSVKFKSIYKE